MKTIEQMLEVIVDDKLRGQLQKLYKENAEKMKQLPASVKYHHAYVGGYHDHVQQIMYYGMRIHKFMDKVSKLDCSQDDVIFLCFIHDHDKLERYIQDGEIKGGDRKGEMKFAKALDFTIDPYAKVISMLAKEGIFLTDEQQHALCYQSGGWSEFAKWDSDMSALATILHCADMLSSKITPSKDDLNVEEAE